MVMTANQKNVIGAKGQGGIFPGIRCLWKCLPCPLNDLLLGYEFTEQKGFFPG